MSRPEHRAAAAPPWGPVAAEDRTPPARPPATVLEAATRELASRHGVPESAVRWTFGAPRRRPHAHLLPLAAHLGAGRRVDAWYKVAFVPLERDGAPDASWLRDARTGIERGRRAAEALRHEDEGAPAAGPPLLLPAVLAAEEALLRTLMTSVPGRPLGRVLGPRPSLLLSPRSVFRRLGAAVRTLEGLAADLPPLTAAAVERRLEGALRRAADSGALPAAVRAPVEARLERLLAALGGEPHGAWVHGDLSGSNVLLRRGGGVGLIDLDWRPRPRAFDLATYSVRLQLESPRLPPLTAAALDALLQGYGGNVGESPAFLVERSQRWLRLLGEGVFDAASRTGRHVVEELRGGRPWLPAG